MELVLSDTFNALPEIDISASQTDILEDTLHRIFDLMPRLQTLYLGFDPHTCLLRDCAIPRDKLTYECSKYQVGLVETTVRNLHQEGRSCELDLGLPYSIYDQYYKETFKDPSQSPVKVGSPFWKPGMSKTGCWGPRFRIFRRVQDQRLDLDSENGVRAGPDIGYWISQSSWDPDTGVQYCFGSTSMSAPS
jgi:hypothetical protein